MDHGISFKCYLCDNTQLETFNAYLLHLKHHKTLGYQVVPYQCGVSGCSKAFLYTRALAKHHRCHHAFSAASTGSISPTLPVENELRLEVHASEQSQPRVPDDAAHAQPGATDMVGESRNPVMDALAFVAELGKDPAITESTLDKVVTEADRIQSLRVYWIVYHYMRACFLVGRKRS